MLIWYVTKSNLEERLITPITSSIIFYIIRLIEVSPFLIKVFILSVSVDVLLIVEVD